MQLSKWWRTASAQAAWERAKKRKRESLNKFLRQRAEKQAQLAKDVANWKVVE